MGTAPSYQASRFWHALGKAGLWRLHGNTLSPFVNGRYVKYGRHCRAHSSGIADRSTDWTLVAPLAVPRAMDPETAKHMVAKVSAAIAAGEIEPPRDLPFYYSVPEPVTFFGDELLSVFDGPLGDALRDVFRSHFRIEWLDYYRTVPGEAKKSWLWHIDNDPPYVVKVLLYLTDSNEENGATRILSPEDTRRAFANGYFGVYGEERTEALLDLEWAKRDRMQELIPVRSAGDAMVFSTNHLHRGGPVRSGFRDVAGFLVVPSTEPWRDVFERTGPAYVHQASGFPADPMTLLEI